MGVVIWIINDLMVYSHVTNMWRVLKDKQNDRLMIILNLHTWSSVTWCGPCREEEKKNEKRSVGACGVRMEKKRRESSQETLIHIVSDSHSPSPPQSDLTPLRLVTWATTTATERRAEEVRDQTPLLCIALTALRTGCSSWFRTSRRGNSHLISYRLIRAREIRIGKTSTAG